MPGKIKSLEWLLQRLFSQYMETQNRNSVTLPNGNIAPSRLAPLKRTTRTYEGDTTGRVLQHRVKLKHPSLRDQDRSFYECRRSSYRMTALPAPRPSQHHVEISPQSLQFFQWEESLGDNQSPCTVGATWYPLLWSHPRGTIGDYGGSTTGALTKTSKGKGQQQLVQLPNWFLPAAPK